MTFGLSLIGEGAGHTQGGNSPFKGPEAGPSLACTWGQSPLGWIKGEGLRTVVGWWGRLP